MDDHLVRAAPDTPPLVGVEPPPAQPLSFFKQLRQANGNSFANIHLAVYEQPIYQQKSVFGRTLWVSDPDGVRRVLVDNVANYPKNALENRFFTAMFGEGLLSSEGAKWRTHRKVMSASFDPRSVAAYAPAMVEATQTFAARWDALGAGAEVDIAEEMKALTLRIICQTMFSSDAEELVGLTGKALGFTNAALNFSLLDILPVIGPMRMKAKEAAIHADFAAMDTAIYRMIAEGERDLADAPKDLLTRLIAAKDPDGGAGLNASEVRDEVITIFMAGHETTATGLAWTFDLLLHDARALARARDLDERYLDAVVKESLRIRPVIPGVGRVVRERPFAVDGYEIPVGVEINPSIRTMHRRADLYPSPGRFAPERFLGPDPPDTYTWIPFGGGTRRCLGASFALMEMRIVLARALERCDLTAVDPAPAKAQLRAITLAPKGGVRVLQRAAPLPAVRAAAVAAHA